MSNPHNILIIKFPYSSTFGGGEQHTITLVDRLRDNHHFWLLSTCSVLVPEFTKRGWPVERIWAGSEPVTPKTLLVFFFTAPFITINLFKKIIQYRFKHNIDTLYCLSLTEKVLVTPLARLFGLRVIWVEHLQIERWLLHSPLRFAYALWSRLATVVTVVEAVKKQLMDLGVPEANIQVIYNSIDIKHFIPHPSTPKDVAQSFDILFIGRLAIEKGINDLIEAIALVRSSIPQVSLTIVGQGDWQAELEHLAEERQVDDIIRFVGWQADVTSWIQQSDALVLPATRRETFGIVLAEALAMVKPVVATNIGGVPEVVGNHGWLVEPHQPQAIATALQEIYNDYEAALRKTQAGRMHVLELFREDTMIQEYDALFQ